MRIFVTGGSGFVGGHVIEALSPSHEVVAMARSPRSAQAVEGFGARAVLCDLDVVTAEHLAGCDVVVHCAAYVEEWGTREQFWRGNVEGTARMLEVARAAGARRFIHIGTEAALFDGSPLVEVDESRPYPEAHRFLYSETKAEAERRVLAAAAPDFVALSLRPRLVWGPRDNTVLPAVLRMAREGAWAWLDGGRARTSTTHVRNLARAVELALTEGRGGHAYFVADEGVRTAREFLTALAATQGVALPDRSVPGALARPLARAVEGVWRLLGIRRAPPVTAFAMSMMSREVTVSTAKARRELGYAPVIDVDAGMRAMR
ncbi:MAG: NAD-dependent epimerase/dehydratase family protein [Polyangiales bacterium]